jgi:hypothetical protein
MIIYQTNPTVTEGNRTKTDVTNIESEDLLQKILTELKKMNLHMYILTDTDVKDMED